MNNMIKIETAKIGGTEINSVNARELWAFLECKSRFNDWIKNRIEKYDFVDGIDFTTITKNLVNGGKSTEYIISIDMAKELAMVENNFKGRQARRYFIEVEKRYKQQYQLNFTALQKMAIANKSVLEMATAQADFFQMDTTAKLLWGQNLLHRYNLPVPDRIPLLENKIISKLYQKREIYNHFGAIGRGSKPKQDNIKSILSEFETDSKYAVNVPYCRNGHTGTTYQYTEKMIEKLEEVLEKNLGVNNGK